MKVNRSKLFYLISFILFLTFSIFCIISIGISYDQIFHIENGERRLKYLLSFGRYDYYDILHLRYYPGLYDTISAFFATFFPRKFYYESFHLINFLFGLIGIIGLKKIIKIFFNKNISKIFFIISIFSPIFFGHLSINPKDTIIATSNFWIMYYVIKYLKCNNNFVRTNIAVKIGLFLGLGIGVRIIFLGTLIPILLFLFAEIFIFKKIIKEISVKNFIKHIFVVFIISYTLLILCWPNVHNNIITEPFKLFSESLSDSSQGVQLSYFFGEFYLTENTPWYYLIINFIFKTPVFLLVTFILFFVFFNKVKLYFNNITNFNYNIYYSLIFFFLPMIISIFLGLKIHDGIRYFLYLVPLFNILPAIYICYLMNNLNKYYNKIIIIFLIPTLLTFLIKFISITPYHYTYLNIFNDLFLKKNYFENDYWGVSLKELIKKFSDNIENNNSIKIAYCGVNPINIKYYLRKNDIKNFVLVDLDSEFDYAILINRAIYKDKIDKIYNTCFSKFKNNQTFLSVNKNNNVLSKIIKY
mgnify:CR=1 FL=1